MKIITWNCNMAYRKKADFLLKYEPDIVVVPECEHPDKLKFKSGIPMPTDIVWHGTNHNKGLGVFSYSDYKFKLHKVHNPDFRIVLPLIVSGGKVDFVLFAIWANNPQDRNYQYIGQVWKAINYYKSLLKGRKTILIGDFNSNAIWDKPHREGNHSTVVEFLKNKKIHSVYHKFFNQTQGQEEHKTLYLYRHKNKPYHIDYCFASTDFAEKITEVKVETYNDWMNLSDHTPLMVTLIL
jgi:exodeoxyribonuclease III